MEKTLHQKMMKIIAELNVPKANTNSYGGYQYRTLEDIYKNLKPLLYKAGLLMTVKDEMILVGDRYYIKATTTITDTESGEAIEGTAFAREPLQQKGMSEAQVTGTASTYARKYCICGLFAIQSEKDPDEYWDEKPEEEGRDDLQNIPLSTITPSPLTADHKRSITGLITVLERDFNDKPDYIAKVREALVAGKITEANYPQTRQALKKRIEAFSNAS